MDSVRLMTMTSSRALLSMIYLILTAVCHILRYFPPAVKIRQIVESGALGEVVVINHTESILYWHFAHSFVRGNWRSEGESSFSLLAKCCHDIDLIMFWMGDMKCTKIQSFGGLYHFRKEQKPEGAASRFVRRIRDPIQLEQNLLEKLSKINLKQKIQEM